MSDKNDVTYLGSGSKLYRTLECPASNHLPQTPKPIWIEKAGDRGTACHTYYEHAPEEGINALDRLTGKFAQYRPVAALMDPSQFASRFTPMYHREVAYAHNGDTGDVREIPPGGEHRDYGTLALADTPLTMDVVIRGYGMLEVWDLKTGKTPVPPPKVNPQLIHGAVCAVQMISPKAERILLGIQQMTPDGQLHDTADVVDRWTLDEHEGRIRLAQRKARVVMQAIEAGETPPVNPGPWCTFCDAKKACPTGGKA